MAQWVCAACSAAYAVGAPCCPQCRSTERAEDQVLNLPRLRVTCNLQGCRYSGIERDVRLRSAGIGLFEVPTLLCAGCGSQLFAACNDLPLEGDDMPKITVHGGASNADDETAQTAAGEEESSPGTSSSTSSAKDETSPEQSKTPSPSRARKTASRSGKARTESSTARGTDGGQTEPTSAKTSDDS